MEEGRKVLNEINSVLPNNQGIRRKSNCSSEEKINRAKISTGRSHVGILSTGSMLTFMRADPKFMSGGNWNIKRFNKEEPIIEDPLIKEESPI